METKGIYTKLTYNIEKCISKFKERKISQSKLNEHLILNISSLYRFLKTKENDKNTSQSKNLNETILDVFVPFSRLSTTLQSRLDKMNEQSNLIEPATPSEFEKALNFEPDLDMIFEKEEEKIKKNENNDIANLIENDDNFESRDYNNQSQNNKYLLDDNDSMSMSLFNHPIEGFDSQNVSSNLSQKVIMSPMQSQSGQLSRNIIEGESYVNLMLKFPIDEDKKKELEEAHVEFKNDITNPRVITTAISEMSIDYLRYMKEIFIKIKGNKNALAKGNDESSLEFINKFKSFVLEIGISDKKFYEQCIREIIYNKSMFEFSEFLECFRKLLNLKFDQTFLKYKCKIIL